MKKNYNQPIVETTQMMPGTVLLAGSSTAKTIEIVTTPGTGVDGD